MFASSVAPRDLTRVVRGLAVPAILHSLLQTLVFVVDRLMLGRYGNASLAAMHLASNLEWTVWNVFAAFEVGTIARVGRHVGAREPALARRSAGLSLVASLVLGSVVACTTPLVLAALPRFAPESTPDALGEAARYLSVTLPASPIVFVSMTSVAILQASGDTKTPLAIGVFANVVHVVLNYVLILGRLGAPALGARGAAISTAISFALVALLATAALFRADRPVSLVKKAGAVRVRGTRRHEARELARIGLPSFVERALYSMGYVGFAYAVARLGDDAMAANQSLISIESLSFLSADGFGVAAATLVAQKLGAGEPDEARRAARIASRDAIVALGLFGAAAFALRGVILPFFSTKDSVLAIGYATMPILFFVQPFMAGAIVLGQAVRGAGRTRDALVVSVVSAVFVRLGAIAFFSVALGLGLPGVWLGSTADWVVRSFLLGAVARRSIGAPAPGRVTA